MNTEPFVRKMRAVQLARDEARRERDRDVEVKAFFSGGALVLTGLLLAAAYCLLSHQIPV